MQAILEALIRYMVHGLPIVKEPLLSYCPLGINWLLKYSISRLSVLHPSTHLSIIDQPCSKDYAVTNLVNLDTTYTTIKSIEKQDGNLNATNLLLQQPRTSLFPRLLQHPHPPTRTTPQQIQLSHHLKVHQRLRQRSIPRNLTTPHTPPPLLRLQDPPIPTNSKRRSQRNLLQNIHIPILPVHRCPRISPKTKPAVIAQQDILAIDFSFQGRHCLAQQRCYSCHQDRRDPGINHEFFFGAWSFGIPEPGALVGVLNGGVYSC